MAPANIKIIIKYFNILYLGMIKEYPKNFNKAIKLSTQFFSSSGSLIHP